ncbi:hypothetical protein [Nocardioides nematodiphilus]|uniref:hypothetical protein n=1 Tax=Nocardioides nematodiphilus TaxID=2849669 RepID=UPI001CD987B9|nr:hypothetical protein [Nocardioides nematodiphilus]MCA1984794.1 hypothetical protein [Nocardioides nematodiphilus]
MAANTGVYVQGLREITRAMEKAGVDVEELKDAMGAVSDRAATVMRPFIPTRTGALRATAHGNRAKGKAVVTIGRGRVKYAGPINYGWPKRSIRAAKFTDKTDDVMSKEAPRILEEGWNKIAERHGLT